MLARIAHQVGRRKRKLCIAGSDGGGYGSVQDTVFRLHILSNVGCA